MKNNFLPVVFAISSIFLSGLMLTSWSAHVARTKMWQEAERRGYAVQAEHSGGTGYKWKDE